MVDRIDDIVTWRCKHVLSWKVVNSLEVHRKKIVSYEGDSVEFCDSEYLCIY